MTEQELAELERLDDLATKGPWEYDGMHSEITTPQGEQQYWLIVSECRESVHQPLPPGGTPDANFALIAGLRNHAKELLRAWRAIHGTTRAAA